MQLMLSLMIGGSQLFAAEMEIVLSRVDYVTVGEDKHPSNSYNYNLVGRFVH